MKKQFYIITFVGVTLFVITVIFFNYVISPKKIKTGMITWDGSGSVIGSREFHIAELFMEDYPDTQIKPVLLDDEWNPDKTPVLSSTY